MKKIFWKTMSGYRSPMIRFENIRHSFAQVVNAILNAKSHSSVGLRIQAELIYDHKHLPQTEVGMFVFRDLQEQEQYKRLKAEKETRQLLREEDLELPKFECYEQRNLLTETV